jgi:hypothetical protein
MRPYPLRHYREVVLVDFEFTAPPGERPTPLCVTVLEFFSGRLTRQWLAGGAPASPPFDTGPDVLFVAYYASAELGCHMALGWPFPQRILDLCAEFKLKTSGLPVPAGRSLLGAMVYHGLDGISVAEKTAMRDLAMRGGPYTEAERLALLDYCQTDVDALAELLPAMLPEIDLPRALLRGRYMAACARMEWVGTPVDTEMLTLLRERWDDMKLSIIAGLDTAGVYDGTAFRQHRWAEYLAGRNIPWPLLGSGKLALDKDTWRDMSKLYPSQVGPYRELRHSLSEMRLNDLAVGADGRNRCLLGAFGAKTGRNTPSNAKYIFGPSVWLRSLIRPQPGMAVAYLDYEQQEFGIAAALSGDQAMMAAYCSGDSYLASAIQFGLAPQWATKKSHKAQRDQAKVSTLSIQYGIGEQCLGERLGRTAIEGRRLLELHHRHFPTYWAWSDATQDFLMCEGYLETAFGWRVHLNPAHEIARGEDGRRLLNPRSFRNNPIQAAGAEMLRLTCCLATEGGVSVCGPVHDAILIEAPDRWIKAAVAKATRVMREASELVLPGFPLRVEAKVMRWPDRFDWDPRGQRMWQTVLSLLQKRRARGPRGNVRQLGVR